MKKIVITITGIWIICILCASPALGEDRFTDNGDGTVTDNVLGLMWAKNDNQGDITWTQADQWVKFTFSIASPYKNWRLPTLEELQSLYVRDKAYEGYETDCGQTVKIIPKIQLSCGWLWTSETRSITAKLFNFNRGYHYTDRIAKNRAYRVLPVRTLK